MIIHKLSGGSKKIAGYAACYNNGLLYYTNNINSINRNNLSIILEINNKFNDYRSYYKEYFLVNLREENEEALQFKYSKAHWFSNFGYININQPSCSSNIINMYKTYYNAYSLTGSPVCGSNVTNMSGAYYNCRKLIDSPVCGPNVTSMAETYEYCYNLAGSPVCGNNVINMHSAYHACHNLVNSPVCGDNVTDMTYTYWDCYNLTGLPVCGSNVIDMTYTYFNCSNLTGSPVCGPNVTNMRATYSRCSKLTDPPICGPNVINMLGTYSSCYNLVGSPICGDNVTNMQSTYTDCHNLTGSPVCGDKVTDMERTYHNCYNLTGSPICGPNVINMLNTYTNCHNLTGSPVCGDNVTDMRNTYANCYNLTGSPVCGSNVINMLNTYYNCYNLMKGDAYFYSKNVINTTGCFYGKSGSNILNIFVYNNSTTLNHLLYTNTKSIFGQSCSWSNNLSSNGYYYCSAKNVYIYPVENIEIRSIFLEIKPQYTFITNSEESITIPYSFAIDNYEIQAISSNNNLLQINETRIENNNFIISFLTKNIEANCSITLTAINLNNQEIIATDTLNISIVLTPQVSYVVEPLTGVTYGFVLNANGYYESQNKGVNSSYSLCKVSIISDGNTTLYVDCINYAESNYDYGILSALNTTLSSSSTADSTYFTSFKGKQSASIQTVNYGIIPLGEHFIYIKYIKDSSVNSNNDSLQFKIRLE